MSYTLIYVNMEGWYGITIYTQKYMPNLFERILKKTAIPFDTV